MTSHEASSNAVVNPWRTLAINIVLFVVMNGLFVIGWLPNAGKPLPDGLFWPAVPILLWGVGLAIYAWRVHKRVRI